ncbi:MAG: hypothetical protein COX19_00775 [Desulfobacterales bacterium CG23_combo_of_CG06-09_8_20_14_all_51_8]|nr:MAG: hypothetical protein COX19_00775 [Desulfobacterales bacterium CG23_combo_of_CG06-09_8_20_14_all_51_8]
MAKKAAKKETKKNAIVEKIQKTSETVSEKIKDYNEKYLAKTVEKGKARLKEYNEKYLAKNIEKGRDALKEYNEKYVVKTVEKSKEYLDRPYKKVSGTIDDMLAKGRDIEKDAMKKLDGVMENGKKFMYKIPMVERVEKKVTSSLNSLPGIINMPNKGEIEKLTLAMQSLNSNIETLKKMKTV